MQDKTTVTAGFVNFSPHGFMNLTLWIIFYKILINLCEGNISIALYLPPQSCQVANKLNKSPSTTSPMSERVKHQVIQMC